MKIACLLIFHFFPPDRPADNSEVQGDPYKTLFIARLVGSFVFPWNVLPGMTRLLAIDANVTYSQSKLQKQISDGNLKCLALLIGSRS